MCGYKWLIPVTIALALSTPLGQAVAAQDLHDIVADAIANPARPESDRKQDADRKSVEILVFSGIKPGDRVADFIPGRGYVTRLFSTIVGRRGHVYAVVPNEMSERAVASVKEIADDPAYPNVTVLRESVNDFNAPEKLDMVWTSMNYHDLHNDFLGPANLSVLNKAVFNALKPGGVYLVMDHAAAADSGLRDTDTLHRIDPEVVRKEVLAAGFKLEAQSDILKNPGDDHTLKVFDPAIRGKTDKFIYRFRKPL